MCQFRARAIAADAAGEASEDEVRLAQAHVSACVPCGRVFRKLRREMRAREFQRAAVAAFLPLPAISPGHVGGVGKLAIWIEQRVNFLPRGGGERTAEALGGAGIAKAAVAGTAIVAAGGALTGHLVHTIDSTQSQAHHRAHATRHVSQPATLAAGTSVNSSLAAASSPAQRANADATARHSLPATPSKSLGYLAVGHSAAKPDSGSGAGGGTNESSARIASTTGTSTRSESTATTETAAPPPSESHSSSTQSGGGTSLGYLGP